MEDLRIQKTRKALKQALIHLLAEKKFEKISVTDICKESGISRITFYTHYDHKYNLVQEIFNDFVTLGRTMFQTKKSTSKQYLNYSNDIQNCLIYVDCFTEIVLANPQFFSPIFSGDNPYLHSVMTTVLLDSVERFVIKQEKNCKLKYSPRLVAGFVIYGLSGLGKECLAEGKSKEQIVKEAKQLLIDLFEKSIFFENQAYKKG